MTGGISLGHIRSQIFAVTAALSTLLLITGRTSADSVTLRGSEIPLRDVTIREIRAGELYYLDRNNRLTRRGLDEISRLGFDQTPKLDEAEVALAENNHDVALQRFLQALLNAEQPVQRLWIHVRLSRLHDFRDEYVSAAGHAAAAMMIEPNGYWRMLEPTCDPVEPTYAQALEADELLREAARQVTDGTLQQTIARMRKIVQPIRHRLAGQYNGPPIAQGSTWSGYSRKQIAEGTILRESEPSPDNSAAASQEPVDEAPAVVAPKPEVAGNVLAARSESAAAREFPAAPARVVDTEAADRSADEIDALLAAGQFAEALNRCEAAGRNAGEQDVGRLLNQWGRALVGVKRPRDAAVMFTRCAVLFPGTEHGLEGLIQTAGLYATEFRRPATSRRLLLRAIELAELQGRDTTVQEVRRLLESQSESP